MSAQEKYGYCTLCRSRCGTVNHVDGNHFIKVVPDTTHPTGEAMCMKGRAAPELAHSPNRVLYPMRRTAPKSADNPGWERISWQEAISTIASKLSVIKAESGAESVVFGVTTPSGTSMSDGIDWVERFIRAFQSPNICYGTEVCNWHKDYAHAFTFGCGMPTADYANADLILLWGHNPTNTWLSQANAIGKGRGQGARMIVVDPRRTALAASADVWLRVRPGMDMVVALGLIRLMTQGRAFHRDFVHTWTNAAFLVRSDNGMLLRARDCGLADDQGDEDSLVVWDSETDGPVGVSPTHESSLRCMARAALDGAHDITLSNGQGVRCEPVMALVERLCAHYTPEMVKRVAGVDAHDLKAAAKLLGSSQRVAYHAWTGVGQQANATQTERALAILYALTGSFDIAGGNRIYTQPPVRSLNGRELLDPGQLGKALGIEERPLGPPSQGWVTARSLYRAIMEAQPYRVRALVAFGTNFLSSQGDVALGRKALEQLEFHVHCDLFETPASRFADIFLPVNTPWEREGLRVGFEINDNAVEHIQLRQQVIASRGESRSDIDIVVALAQALGMDDTFFQGDIDAGWNWMLEPTGLTVQQLREKPKGLRYPLGQVQRKYARVQHGQVEGFATPSRRVELYSETLLAHGYDPLPNADAVLAGLADGSPFPYMLTSVKNGYFCHSQHRSLVSLRRRSPEPEAQISEALAARKQIEDGDWVVLKTSEGSARFKARLCPDLDTHVIVAEFGWWQACNEQGLKGYPLEGEGNSNYNALISARNADPISGSVPMRSSRCDIQRDSSHDIERRAWAGFRPFKVRRTHREAEDVLAIELVTPDGTLVPDYRPGQHITLKVKIGSEEATLIRAYSLTGPAREKHRTGYRIAVRYQRSIDDKGHSVEGQVSSYLHKSLEKGQEVLLGAPGGNFVVPVSIPQPVVIFAGGIGITPFISYLESLAEASDMPEVWLHYANRNSSSHAFSQRINELQDRLPRLTVINYYNDPLPNDRQGTDYDSNALMTADVVSTSLIERRARVYLCGPGPMMDAITRQLVARGVPRFDIFSEVFRSPMVLAPTGDQHYRVSFQRSHPQPLEWTPVSGPLLEFAETKQISLPSGCRVGQCESCAVRIVSGRVYHLNGQEPEDPSVCLTCQAVPASDLELDI